jgi:methylated-DNA-protein-cysteine methyltransferase related protein
VKVEKRVVGPGFYASVYEVVRRVPYGRLTTYGDVATILGSPRVARQVGWALAALRGTDTDVPWHRVINAKGTISLKGDIHRPHEQRLRLEAEGVSFDDQGRCDLKGIRWTYEDDF